MNLSDIRESWFPSPTKSEAVPFLNAVTISNLGRERILAALMICASAILMAVDYLARGDTESSWNLAASAILSRGLIIAFLATFLYATRRPVTRVEPRHRTWDAAFVIVCISWMSTFSGALLAVRPGIEPYLTALFTIAALVLQGTRRSMLTFGAGLVFFSLSAAAARPEQRLMLSALINGSISTLLAFVISQVAFVVRLRDFRNDAYITEQKRELMESNERLQRLSFIDPLTNIANRRFLEISLSREWKLHARSGLYMSVLMIDIDWFKSLNDTYGHLTGDDCLRRVASALESVLRRPTDLVTRYGGEEFCILLPMTERDGAICTGKRVLQVIRGLEILHQGSPLGRVTVSMGISGCRPEHRDRSNDLLRSADKALYDAKTAGKNRIAWRSLIKTEGADVLPLPEQLSLDMALPLESHAESYPVSASTQAPPAGGSGENGFAALDYISDRGEGDSEDFFDIREGFMRERY